MTGVVRRLLRHSVRLLRQGLAGNHTTSTTSVAENLWPRLVAPLLLCTQAELQSSLRLMTEQAACRHGIRTRAGNRTVHRALREPGILRRRLYLGTATIPPSVRMIKKTAFRRLGNLFGLTICQSAPRRRAHLVDTVLPPAPWLRLLARLQPLPLFPLTLGHPLLLLLVRVATLLLEVDSVALAAAVASQVTMRLVAEEGTVPLVSVEAEAVDHLQVASAVARAMLSANNKTSHNHLQDPVVHSLHKVLRHLSGRTAIPPQPPTPVPNASPLMASPSPTHPQALAPALSPAVLLHRTDARPSPLSRPAPAIPASAATFHPALPAIAAVNPRSATRSPLNPPTLLATFTPLCATFPRSYPAVAKPLQSSTAHA